MDSSSFDKGYEGVSPVTTDKDEGVMGVGEKGGGVGSSTADGRGCAVWVRGDGGVVLSCLFAQDPQDHRANSTELLPVLAGRLDGSPESRRTPDGRLMIIVPKQSPCCAKG